MNKRERYERANLRGGMGVRQRLSDQSKRNTYRLNGVQTGSAVARCYDKYGRWEFGYTYGVIVRRTGSTVQIHWLGDEDITSYSQGDARYEVDRGRWRILGVLRGNPLNPNEPLVDALTRLAIDARIPIADDASNDPDQGDDDEMRSQSKAATEREAAKAAAASGSLQERETYTAKQVATRCGTDSKTMRKFFRSSHSTVEPVGQGGRYEFDAKDLPKIKKEFTAWRKRSEARSTKPAPKVEPQMVRKTAQDAADGDFTAEQIEDAINDQLEQEDNEPSADELQEIEADLDELDADEIEDED